MESTILGLKLDGQLTYRKFTITYKDVNTVANTTATLNLKTPDGRDYVLPQGSIVLAARAKHSVAFAGGAISDMSFVVGKAGTTNWLITDLDIDAAVADTTLVNLGTPTSNVGHADVALIATIGSTGANLTALTAGSVDVYLLIAEVTTPSA